jgi:hypothetical protein
MAEAKRTAAERRAQRDAAEGAWADILERVALPVSHQMLQALRAEGHGLQLFTPGGSMRIGVDSRPDDFVELSLQTDGEESAVVARVSRSRGRETVLEERPVVRGAAAIAALSEEQVVDFLARALAGVLVR